MITNTWSLLNPDYADSANGADRVAAKDMHPTVARLSERAVLFKRYLWPIEVFCQFLPDMAKVLTAPTCLAWDSRADIEPGTSSQNLIAHAFN